jgi:DNA (cytosine-5)-methyltransferase 1
VKVLDLFSGIGGFSLGLERAGFQTIAFCEIEPYCQKVLKKHWPDIPIYEDVRHVTKERLDADGIFPDVTTGGFPCQDISVAGKQAGIEGERSGLWSECARILGEFRPRYAIFENVTALISGDRGKWFERVLWDISQVGYDAEWHCIPASSVSARHQRDRVWLIAYPRSIRVCELPGGGCLFNKKQYTAEAEQGRHELKVGAATNGKRRTMADTMCIDVERNRTTWEQEPDMGQCYMQIERGLQAIRERGDWAVEPDVGRVANGIPKRMDRLKGLGNAVVPQIPEIIGRAILESHHRQ